MSINRTKTVEALINENITYQLMLKEKDSMYTSEIQHLTLAINNKEAEIATLTQKNRNALMEIGRLSSRNHKLNTDNQSYVSQLDELKSKYAELETELASKKASYDEYLQKYITDCDGLAKLAASYVYENTSLKQTIIDERLKYNELYKLLEDSYGLIIQLKQNQS